MEDAIKGNSYAYALNQMNEETRSHLEPSQNTRNRSAGQRKHFEEPTDISEVEISTAAEHPVPARSKGVWADVADNMAAGNSVHVKSPYQMRKLLGARGWVTRVRKEGNGYRIWAVKKRKAVVEAQAAKERTHDLLERVEDAHKGWSMKNDD